MRVTVQVFARLRELAGRSEWPCDVQSGATIAEVWQQSAAAYPALTAFTTAVSCARNEDFARMTATVQDGDVIAFLPPVSGG
ncbi:MAG TPA: MoaD/ThiS family protein [Vicinamibacterales bacterium]|nr:MoaD/ThiS family protein [Vicinamibacterales bacterium]